MKKYDNYKDSGIEWIGKIPEHWEVKPLKYLVKCNSEALTEKTNPEMEINYIEIGDVSAFDGIKETSLYTFEKAPSRARRIVREGDVIISTVRTYLKAITSISSNFDGYIASTGFAVLTPKLIHSGFLGNIALNEGLIGEIISLSKGVSYPSITAQDLTNISIPFPSDKEQNAIANYLDHKTTQIDTLISKKQQFISLLQEERIALINQAVTKGLDLKVKMKDSGIEWLGEIPEHWDVTRLGFLSSKIGDGLHGTPNYVENSEYKFINGNNIGNGQISIYEHTKCVSEEEYFSNKKELNKNSILMSINGTIGNLAFYKGEKVMLGKSVAYINIIDSKALNFTYKYLESESCKTYIDNQLSGSTIKNLSLYSINKIPIPFPNYDEQNAIVNFIEMKTKEIDTIISKTQQEIELLKEYKTALINEVVTGKVDVRDVVLN